MENVSDEESNLAILREIGLFIKHVKHKNEKNQIEHNNGSLNALHKPFRLHNEKKPIRFATSTSVGFGQYAYEIFINYSSLYNSGHFVSKDPTIQKCEENFLIN